VLGHEFEMRMCEGGFFRGSAERGWHSCDADGRLSHRSLRGRAPAFDVGTDSACDLGYRLRGHCTMGAGDCGGKLTMMKNTVDPMATQRRRFWRRSWPSGATAVPEHVIDGKEGLIALLRPGVENRNLLTDGPRAKSWRITQCGMKFFPTGGP